MLNFWDQTRGCKQCGSIDEINCQHSSHTDNNYSGGKEPSFSNLTANIKFEKYSKIVAGVIASKIN